MVFYKINEKMFFTPNRVTNSMINLLVILSPVNLKNEQMSDLSKVSFIKVSIINSRHR